MSALRRHYRLVSLLVIAAMFLSPIARTFCRALPTAGLNVAAANASLMAPILCRGNAIAPVKTAGHPAHGHGTSDCPVCLALAAAVAAATGIPNSYRAVFEFDRVGLPYSQCPSLAQLHLGGIGSRAPPVTV